MHGGHSQTLHPSSDRKWKLQEKEFKTLSWLPELQSFSFRCILIWVRPHICTSRYPITHLQSLFIVSLPFHTRPLFFSRRGEGRPYLCHVSFLTLFFSALNCLPQILFHGSSIFPGCLSDLSIQVANFLLRPKTHTPLICLICVLIECAS